MTRYRDIKGHARIAAQKASTEDEPYLNPYKNRLSRVWNAHPYTGYWRKAFLDECNGLEIADSEIDAVEVYHGF